MAMNLSNPLANDRFAAALGIQLLDVQPGHATTQLTIGEVHTNSLGLIHGGVLFTLAATAFFAAVNAMESTGVGIAMQLSCLHALKEGVLTATAREVSRSRRISTCTVEVRDAHEQLIALFQGTAYLKKQ
jgi:acyl-CoA thioesterase